MPAPTSTISALAAAIAANLTAAAVFPVDDANGVTRKVTLPQLRTAIIRVFDVTDPQFGAKGDGVTDDTAAIQAASLAARTAALVDGRSGVYFPGTPDFYNLTGSIDPWDNVQYHGDGYTSFLKNTRSAVAAENADGLGYLAGEYSNTSIFRFGGYESSGVFLASNDTFYACGDEFKGQHSVSLSSLAHAAHFAIGQIVFLRTTAKDQYQRQKDVFRAVEINEVVDVDSSTGVIRLKHPLGEDYRGCFIAVSGLRTIGSGAYVKPLRVTTRASVEDLRLETPLDFAVGAFSYGGMYECTLRNLDIRCTDAFMVNVMGRSTIERCRVRFSGRLGEISYFSHDNTFRHIDATYERKAGYAPGNGFAANEGARDTLLQHVTLNMGDAGTRGVIFGSGRRNTLRDAKVISPQTSRLAICAIQEVKLDYKPQACVFDNLDIIGGSNSNTAIAPLAAVELDSGGPFGGGNVVRNIRGQGRFTLGVVLLSRVDVAGTPASGAVPAIPGPIGSGYGCHGNTVENITHVAGDNGGVEGLPRISAVVEWNNHSPVGGVEAIVDARWRPGDNVIRNCCTRLRQPAVHQQGLGATRPLTLTTLREYRVLQDSGGTHTRHVVRAEGSFNGTAGTKTVLLRGAGLDITSIVATAPQVGRWWIEAEIGGRVLDHAVGATLPATGGAIQSKRVLYRTGTQFGGTVAESRGVMTQAADTNAGDYVLELQTDISDVADDVTVDLWSVTPSGDDWSFVNWQLVSTIEGGYPLMFYTVPENSAT